ncbi:segregation and condensation protein A [Clostridium tetanomorphum]|nr:segregation and condensation protein A [Clostridium tetanomorphum]
MALKIKIHNFEGPFDLLLHLIKKNEMDIYNIRISEITNQYIQYINTLKEMDLEITSEFIVIAATLLQIKSKELLPKIKNDENIVAEEDEDPEKILIQKLIEYKKFKAAAEFFKSKMAIEGIRFTKKPEIIENRKECEDTDILKNISMLDLYNLYNELVTIYKNKINTNIISREIIVDQYK